MSVDDPAAPPAKASPKPDPKNPPQTFTPSEDKELAALKEVPVVDLIGMLSAAKQRDLAGRALVARGKDAVEPLVAALDAEDAQVRAAAAFALGQLGQAAEPAKAKLTKMSQDDQNDIARDAATFALDALAEQSE
jgi:HEAT repeat protein